MKSQRIRKDLIYTLRLTLWFVPVLMSGIGLAYTIVEHQRHVDDPVWPWPTLLAVVVLVVIGPILCWFVLRWGVRIAREYLHSQEELSHRAEELAVLNKLIVASRSLELEETLTAILDRTMEALDATAGMLFLQNGDAGGLTLETHRGISTDMADKEAHLVVGHCLCGQAIESRQVLFAPQIAEDPRCTSDLCICEGFRSVACAPLDVKGQLVGLIQLASPHAGHFSTHQYDFLNAAAAQVSVSIENARLYDQVRSFNLKLEREVVQRTGQLEAAHEDLAEKARQLQSLLSESYRIQEETQARIAHDMHDGVTQTIIGALYETQAAQETLLSNPSIASINLSRAQQLLTEVDQEIRRVIYDLHPPVLDMLGLVVATKRYAATCAPTFEIDCRVRVVGEPQRMAKHDEVTVYRIIQSAMQNVATHSQAVRAQVIFYFQRDVFRVLVEDNGIGFDPQATLAMPGDHLGLIGMIERAESLGASLMIDSTPGKGSKIILQMSPPGYLTKPSPSDQNESI